MSSQLRKWEKLTIPTAHPSANTKSTGIFKEDTADITNSYLPKRSNMKLPDIPGSIIAQMAIDPLRKTNHNSSGVWPGLARQMKAPVATPASREMMFWIFHLSNPLRI